MAIGSKTGGRPKGLPKTGGRQKGTPNNATAEVREAISAFAAANVGKMSEWLNSIESPEKKLELYLRAIEYHIPKLGRMEVTGKDGESVSFVINNG